jgi:ribosome-associated translation inhibitor RaiA
MNLTIKILAIGEPKTLLSDTRKKLEQFFKMNQWVKEADVRLTYGHGIDGNKVCELYLKTDDKNIFTIERAANFDEAVNKALKKMSRIEDL